MAITTSAAYDKIITGVGGRKLHSGAHVDFADGRSIELDDRNIMQGYPSIEDAVSESDRFQVGAAIINELRLQLNNFEGAFNQYNFKGAVITPWVGLTTAVHWRDGEIVEKLHKGVFTVYESPTVGSVVSITADDNMAKFDVPYSKSTLTYPATLGQIAIDVCSACGVALATTVFPNSTYTVAKRPSDSSTTCREILSYVAQLAGCFARCNSTGAVEIRWYQEPATIFDVGHQKSSISVDAADTVITGVQIEGNDSDRTIYKAGEDGFVVRIKDNPLAQDGLQSLVNALGTKFTGFAFRAYSVSSPSNPAIEAGDVVDMTDKQGNKHRTLVSSLSYEHGETEEFNADAETPEENQSERFSAADKAQDTADQAQEGVEEAKTEITQLNGQIVLKADKGSLVAEINISPETIKISADKLELSGLVTITSLKNGTTTIDGSCIKTGKISADRIDTEELSAGKLIGEDYPDTYVRIGSNPQTSSSPGMSIISDGDTILGFYADGSGGAVGFTSGTLQIVADQSLGLTCDPRGEIALGPNVELEGNTTVDGSINFKGSVRVDGDSGFSGSTVLQGADGSRVGLSFKNGILVDTY